MMDSDSTNAEPSYDYGNTTYVILYDPSIVSEWRVLDRDLYNKFMDGTISKNLKSNHNAKDVLMVPVPGIKSAADLAAKIPQGTDVQLVLLTHGTKEGIGWENPDKTKTGIYYWNLFQSLPQNVEDIYNLSCLSENEVDQLLNYKSGVLGTGVYSFSGDKFSSISVDSGRALLSYANSYNPDFELEMYKYASNVVNQEAMYNRAYWYSWFVNDTTTMEAATEAIKTIKNDPKEIYSERFAILGYGVVNLVDEMDKLAKRDYSGKLPGYGPIQQKSIDSVAQVFGISATQVLKVSNDIQTGVDIRGTKPEEYPIALALTLKHLKDTGQINFWKQQAHYFTMDLPEINHVGMQEANHTESKAPGSYAAIYVGGKNKTQVG